VIRHRKEQCQCYYSSPSHSSFLLGSPSNSSTRKAIRIISRTAVAMTSIIASSSNRVYPTSIPSNPLSMPAP